jgi:hypothetical protein
MAKKIPKNHNFFFKKQSEKHFTKLQFFLKITLLRTGNWLMHKSVRQMPSLTLASDGNHFISSKSSKNAGNGPLVQGMRRLIKLMAL